jgi:hypothetical protein
MKTRRKERQGSLKERTKRIKRRRMKWQRESKDKERNFGMGNLADIFY